MNRLAAEMRQFGRKVREDVRNLKWVKSPAAAAETTDEKMFRIHSAKPAPPARIADPDTITATKIVMNGQVIEDFGDQERTYGPAYIRSGGKEYNLRNANDQYNFMQDHWPDCPQDRWPSVYGALHLQGRVTREGAAELVRKLKAGHIVVAAKDLPH